MKLKELTELFRKLGASEPEGWARSQLDAGIPQLSRFLFLRQAWRQVVDEKDSDWIDRCIDLAREQPNEAYAGAGHALRTLRARGATDEELTELVRSTQAELLFSLCYLLDDPMLEEPELSDLSWALFELDRKGRPKQRIGGLHESVLETDPTGRECRPHVNPDAD